MLMVVAIAVAVEAVNGLLLIAMLALARHAWLTMPPSVPFPRLGGRSWPNQQWDFKEHVLASWLFADAVTWLGTSACIMGPVFAGSQAMTPGQASVLPLLLVVPGIVLAVQHSGLEKARALEDAVQAEAREDAAQPDRQSE
jgi:hypothetical protein